MAAYFDRLYSPGDALAPRAGFVAFDGGAMVGYVAGHHTTRWDSQGEIEYLFVAPTHRRRGVARELTRLLAGWFVETGALKVCVNADADTQGVVEFYLACGATRVHRYWLVWENVGTDFRA
jgi:GNAT superfamily N-acetyltransferase